VGGSLGCDGCGPTECFRVTHKSSSGPYLCTHTQTHTLEKGGGKKMKVERMNYRASRWRMMAV
jgi:hypothetical protein